MKPANSDDAMREVALDVAEGADVVMVKPALHFLDIIYRANKEFGTPTAAYFLSGEYSQIKAVLESHMAVIRVGADMIITYYARRLADML